MAQKRRSVSLSNTVYVWLEEMVSTGEYSDLDDAATDLLMQIKRGTHSKPTRIENVQAITPPVLASTPPVLASTHTEPIAVEPPRSSQEPTTRPIAESPADELERLRALRPMERMKHSARITELKELLEA